MELTANVRIKEPAADSTVGRSLALFAHPSTPYNYLSTNGSVAYSSMPPDDLPAYGTTTPLNLSKLPSSHVIAIPPQIFQNGVDDTEAVQSARVRRHTASFLM